MELDTTLPWLHHSTRQYPKRALALALAFFDTGSAERTTGSVKALTCAEYRSSFDYLVDRTKKHEVQAVFDRPQHLFRLTEPVYTYLSFDTVRHAFGLV